MKKSVYCIILGLMLLTLSSCKHEKQTSQSGANEVKMEESHQDQDVAEEIDLSQTLDQFEGAYDASRDIPFLQSIEKVANEMVDAGFVYNTSKISASLDKAKEGNCHGDCAHLISWALQDMGILTSKQTFYSKKGGVLSCEPEGKIYNALIEHASIIEVDPVKASDQEALKKLLKVGDICCYSLHMNVVAGINKKGDIIYYDAGLTPVVDHKSGQAYTDQLRNPYSRPNMKNTLYTIIRLD